MLTARIIWPVCVVVLLEQLPGVAAETRRWLSASSKHHIEAELITVEGENVHLKKRDGRVIRVLLSQLSEADRRFVQKLAEKKDAADDGPASRVAIVRQSRDRASENVVTLAEVALTEHEGIQLVERQQIDQLLTEQALSQTGLVGSAEAVRIGRVLRADMLAVINTVPVRGGRPVLGLVVFDTARGIRLVDATLSGDVEQLAEALAQHAIAAGKKLRQSADDLQTVSVISTHNVDLPVSQEGMCMAIGSLLARRLVSSPQVAVLDRRFLSLVTKERALTNDERQALLASVRSIQVEVRRNGRGLAATAIVTNPDGSKKSVNVSRSDQAVVELAAMLSEAVLKHVGASVPTAKPDRRLDAQRAISQADAYFRHGDFHQAFELAEVAVALVPDDPSVWTMAPMYGMWYAYSAIDPGETRTSTLPRMKRKTPEAIETFLKHMVRVMDLQILVRRHQIQQGKFQRTLGHVNDAERTLRDVFQDLLIHPVPRTPKAEQYLDICQERYRHLVLDMLIPAYRKAMESDLHEWDVWQPYVWLVYHAHHYCRTSTQFTDVMLEHLDWTLATIEKRGAFELKTKQGMTVSYIRLLTPITSLRGTRQWRWSAEDLGRLRERVRPLEKHKRPAIRLWAMSALLFCDLASGKYRDGTAPAEAFKATLGKAPKMLDEALAKNSKAERHACYAALLSGIDSLPKSADPPVLGMEIGRLMKDRNEAVLSVSRRICFKKLRNHNHYFPPSGYTDLLTIEFPQLWNATVSPKAYDEIYDNILTINKLWRQKKVIDDNSFALDADLEIARREIYEVRADLAQASGDKPWTKAVRLFQGSPTLEQSSISRACVHGNHVYIVMTKFGRGRSDTIGLVRIGLDDHKVKPLSALRLSAPPPGKNFAKTWRNKSPVVSPHIHDGKLYCALPRYGGIGVFPLTATPAMRMVPKNTPGMPTEHIDDLAIVDGRIFALTSGLDTNEPTYVHWYDPADGGWKVVASSRRASPKTPADWGAVWEPGSIVDVPRHRILFLARGMMRESKLEHAMFEFDYRTNRVRKLFTLPETSCSLQKIGTDSVVVAVMRGYEHMSNAYEFHLPTNTLRPFYRRLGAPEADIGKRKPRFENRKLIWPPFEIVEDQLWTFSPFGRIGEKGFERFSVLEIRFPFTVPHERSNAHQLKYLPDRKSVLYGNELNLWLLKFK